MTPEATIVTGLSTTALDVDALCSHVRRDDCGAVVVFEGTVRSPNNGETVAYLEYEAYDDVAERQLRALAEHTVSTFSLGGVVAVHRIGRVDTGLPAVVVAVSAGHRSAAFAGASSLIDRIKSEVAIWKREVTIEGAAHWVDGSTGRQP